MADEPLPDDLADAVLDGGAVDWATAEARAAAEARPLLAHLQVVASVARAQRDSPPPLTDRWGHLRLLESIGRGAFGEVYRAWDTRLDREVALKLLPAVPSADDGSTSEIIREGRLLARVHHPNIVTIYGAEQIGDRVGLWMEFIHGQTLEQLLQEKSVFPTPDVLHIGVEVARAVSAVHAAGLLHRDIKAQNVMRAVDGRVVLMDFGAGRELDDDAPADVVGTPLYLAPEVLQGKPATVQSDVYSLGVLLFRITTGTYPVSGRSVRELRDAHTNGPRVSVREAQPKVATPLARVIDQATDGQPERRLESAATVVDSLTHLQRRARIRPWLYAASVAALLIVAGFVAWLRAPSAVSSMALVPRAPGPGVVRPSVEIQPLLNASGRAEDNWLGAVLAEMLLREFRGAETFRWIPSAPPVAYLHLGPISAEGPSRIRQTIPADIVISGEYVVVGQTNALRLTLRMHDGRRNVALATVSDTEARTALVELMTRIGISARAALAAPPLTTSQASALRYSQPANADAARAYVQGLASSTSDAVQVLKQVSEGVQLLKQAVAADPRFAPAHIRLAEMLRGAASSPNVDARVKTGPDEADAVAARALELASGLPIEERMLIEARAWHVRRGLGTAKANQARDELLRRLFELFPDTLEYGLQNVIALRFAGQNQDGLAMVDRLRPLPGASDHLRLLQLESSMAQSAGDYRRAQRASEDGVRVAAKHGDPFILGTLQLQLANVAQALGELPESLLFAEEALRTFSIPLDKFPIGNPTQFDTVLIPIRSVTRAPGNLDWANATYERLIANAKNRGNRASEGTLRCLHAGLLLDRGDLSEARVAWAPVHRDWRPEELPFHVCSLLGLGDVLFRLGEFSAALKAYQNGLAMDARRPRLPEDRSQETRFIHRIAQTLLEQGEVVLAREHADRMLDPSGSRWQLPAANLSARTFMAQLLRVQGDEAAARPLMQEVSAHRYVRDGVNTLFDVFMTSSLIALDDGRLSESRELAQKALNIARGLEPDREAAAASMLALGWLREGNLVEARQCIAPTEARLPVTQDRLLRLTGGIAVARVRAASGSAEDVVAARRQLESLIQEAGNLGAVAIQFDARLALGQIEIKAGQVAPGRARLATLRREASAKGFASLAAKAAAAAR